ncbi:MAG: AAA family ATPase, partial [Chloroflexi bacterium]|nr:AAA family ATPase [Chloroflexota bacterium]
MTDQLSLFGADDTPSNQKNAPPAPAAGEPLAARMRPHTLDEIIGQEHLLGPGRILRSSIESDHISSMIFWGPPGSGKTTLAEVIARQTHARYVRLSAVSAGV